MKYLFLSCLLAVTFLFGACSKPVELKFDGVNYYQTINHQTVAFDRTNWFQLRRSQQSFGEMRGASIGQSEIWLALTGSDAGNRNALFVRTQATRNNTNLPPIFIKY